MIEGLKKEVVCKENLQVGECRFTKEERGACHSQELQIPQARIGKGKASVMLECAASFGIKNKMLHEIFYSFPVSTSHSSMFD